MSSGLVTGPRSSREKFFHTPDRRRAQQFSKLAAEELVGKLRSEYRLTAQVEAAETAPLAPYQR